MFTCGEASPRQPQSVDVLPLTCNKGEYPGNTPTGGPALNPGVRGHSLFQKTGTQVESVRLRRPHLFDDITAEVVFLWVE